MKLFKVIKKNFQVLLRSKTSALVVLIGPLLIILLIGLAFNNMGTSFDLSIGVYSETYNNDTNNFISGLEEKYEITKYQDNITCIDSVKEATSNICIVFPKDLTLDDDQQDELKLYVDESRMNLVDTVVNKISAIIGINSESASKDLTTTLLNTISLTKSEVEASLLKTVTAKQSVDSLISDTDNLNSEASGMDLDMVNVDMSNIETGIDSLYSKTSSLKTKGLLTIGEALDFIDDVGNVSNSTIEVFTSLKTDITNLGNTSLVNYNDLIAKIDVASTSMGDIETKLSTAKTKRTNIVSKANVMKSNLDSLKTNIIDIKSSLEKIGASISSIKVFNADNIINPITTTINPISTSSKKSTFLLPSLIILIIMFIGIMLSGTSIIIDKISPASFRAFTAPTRDSFYLFSYFLTNIIIVLAQIIIIGGLAVYFLKVSILGNIALTIFIILLSASLFILIGMAFGFMFKSQEGVTIASLSFASVLLFVSNLIIPLETTPLIVQNIAKYNPFVILSEALKKAMLFNIEIKAIIMELIIIILYIIILFILILIVQKLTKIIYFKRIPHIKHRKMGNLTPEHYFRLIDGEVLKNKEDLLNFLQECKHEEFKEFVDHERNKFVAWLKDILKEKHLAKKLKGVTDKNTMIKIIEDDVARTSIKNGKSFIIF